MVPCKIFRPPLLLKTHFVEVFVKSYLQFYRYNNSHHYQENSPAPIILFILYNSVTRRLRWEYFSRTGVTITINCVTSRCGAGAGLSLKNVAFPLLLRVIMRPELSIGISFLFQQFCAAATQFIHTSLIMSSYQGVIGILRTFCFLMISRNLLSNHLFRSLDQHFVYIMLFSLQFQQTSLSA